MTARRPGPRVVAAIVLVVALTGCAQISSVVGDLSRAGSRVGVSSAGSGAAFDTVRTLGDVANAATSPFSPEQEYYIGRSVSATILRDYRLHDSPGATAYLNRLGQSLALASERPALYHGYTFAILDTDEINAFATPGGHVFVSRGMLALTSAEDELAAVLAHEIGHVALRHGLGSIRTGRVISAVQDGTFTMVERYTDRQVQELTSLFGDTTSDIFDTLATRGYSGPTERQADSAAVAILQQVGYDPFALIRVLERMDAAQEAESGEAGERRGFSRTHPAPRSRINDLLRTDLRNAAPFSRIDEGAAQQRFEAVFGTR
jgi:beta-barrel assembly-enhancing protease